MPTTLRLAMRLALRAQLKALASLPPVAWEKQAFTPTIGVLHLRENLLFSDTSAQPFTLGPVVNQRVQAVYQVSIYTPRIAANGTMPTTLADTWAGKICDQFKPGTALTYDGRRLVMLGASAGRDVDQPPDWSVLPVSVYCYAEMSSMQ